jgi:hypothetical protein
VSSDRDIEKVSLITVIKFYFPNEFSIRGSRSMRWTSRAYMAKFSVLTADAIGAFVESTRGESRQTK